jgi:hypothetical protein
MNLENTIKTAGITIFCTVWGLSMHQSCQNLTKKPAKQPESKTVKQDTVKADIAKYVQYVNQNSK